MSGNDNDESGTGGSGPPPGSALPGQVHDAFFKKVFRRPEHAARFFQAHLPPTLVRCADWESLRALPDSFVKPALGQLHSDLLFSLRTGSEETLLYLLFEHQSRPDRKMPLRLFGYIGEILLTHHARSGYPLHAVLPVVLNQGPAPWGHPTRFQDLFVLPEETGEELCRFVPSFEYILIDLARRDPVRDEGDEFNRIVLDLFKAARIGAQVQFLRRFVKGLTGGTLESTRQVIMDTGLFGEMLVYIFKISKDLDAEELLDIVSEDTQAKEIAMTAADQLIEKGIRKGIEKGIEKGIRKGIRKGIQKGSLIGEIRATAKFAGRSLDTEEPLEEWTVEDLRALAARVEREYERRFKSR